MTFPKRFENLPDYAFPRLRALLGAIEPANLTPIDMTIGSPRHAAPDFVGDILADNIDGFRGYPPNEGAPELLQSISGFLQRRYGVDIESDRLLALNGTREGLFNAALAVSPEEKDGQKPVILTPNPFYQVYAVAAVTVGAEPVYVNATQESGHLPEFSKLSHETLSRTTIAYICSPSNPQGAVATRAFWAELFELAERYDFKVFADECYSEVYFKDPPVGALEVAQEVGLDPERLVVFHSLSKRSNLAGLRSGFAVAGLRTMQKMRRLRAYAGAPLPLPLQKVAAKAWSDETHVETSRALYAEKFAAARDMLGEIPGVVIPEAGFFLWLPVENDEDAATRLWTEKSVRVLPGGYLARESDGLNPGSGFVRVALVGKLDEVKDGLERIRSCLYQEQ